MAKNIAKKTASVAHVTLAQTQSPAPAQSTVTDPVPSEKAPTPPAGSVVWLMA